MSSSSESPENRGPITRLRAATLRQAELARQALETDPIQAQSFIFDQDLSTTFDPSELSTQSSPVKSIGSSLPASQVPSTLPSAALTPAIYSARQLSPVSPVSEPTIRINMSNQQANNQQIVAMPARNHASAPKFDSTKPRELSAYFDELEVLLRGAGITDEKEKKVQARRYLEVEDADIWSSIPEYRGEETYEDYKKKIYQLYPGASEESRHTMTDLDKLVGKHMRLGIHTAEELGKYYRQFYVITTYLIEKEAMATMEQSRMYIKAFSPELREKVKQRLQLKNLDRRPDRPYPLSDIHKEALYVLQGSGFEDELPAQDVASPSPAATTKQIKAEDIVAMMDRFADKIVAGMASGRIVAPGYPVAATAPAAAQRPTPWNNGRCNFCGIEGHFIPRCPEVEEYVRLGKVVKNAEGKIVLPGGGFVPRSIPGQWLKERIDEWYRQTQATQVAQPAASRPAALMYEIRPRQVAAMHASIEEQEYDERILRLQQEIAALNFKKKKMVFDGVEIPTKAKAGPKPAATNSENAQATSSRQPSEAVAPVSATAPVAQSKVPPPVVAPIIAPPPAELAAPTTQPEHPYRGAKDANYLPPKDRNYGAAPTTRNQEPAYRTLAPVQDPKLAEDVYRRTMKETTITLSAEELLSLSPEVRQRFKDAIMPRRVNVAPKAAALNNVVDGELPYAEETSGGGWIIPDPAEAFYQLHGHGGKVKVARDSASLRSIMMIVEHKEEVECILDNGCMVVAMSDGVCHALGITYDPTFRLQMESANGEVDETLGLARNVPFSIGPVTLFFQVHVVSSPAYDILLGRPFDVLTESCVKNFRNESQTITITDPNTGKTIAIPTVQRGRPRYVGQGGRVQPDFRQQRN